MPVACVLNTPEGTLNNSKSQSDDIKTPVPGGAGTQKQQSRDGDYCYRRVLFAVKSKSRQKDGNLKTLSKLKKTVELLVKCKCLLNRKTHKKQLQFNLLPIDGNFCHSIQLFSDKLKS